MLPADVQSHASFWNLEYRFESLKSNETVHNMNRLQNFHICSMNYILKPLGKAVRPNVVRLELFPAMAMKQRLYHQNLLGMEVGWAT